MAVSTIVRGDPARPAVHGSRSALLGAVMSAVVGAVYFLAPGRALDYDGSVTVGTFVRRGSLLDVFRTNFAFNNHPYFSFVEHLIWDAGGRSEPFLRIVPIACAAATVGVVAAWCASRWGAVAGVVGGSVLAANPLFTLVSRSVRGYSLMVLGATIATVLLIAALDRDGAMTKRQAALYVGALGIAIGTQSYAGLVLLAHVATLVAEGRFSTAWRRRIELVVALGIAPYLGMIHPLLHAEQTRRGTFQPFLPAEVARDLLGRRDVAVVALGVLVIAGLLAIPVRRRFRPAALAMLVPLAVVWTVMHPLDLGSRFLVWLVPVVAVAAAWAVAKHPALVVVAVVALGSMVASEVPTWNADPIASRQIAHVVEAARAAGEQPCAISYSTDLLLGYTRGVRTVSVASDLPGCDLVFGQTDYFSHQIARFRCAFAHSETLRAKTPIVVLSDPRPAASAAGCAATRP